MIVVITCMVVYDCCFNTCFPADNIDHETFSMDSLARDSNTRVNHLRYPVDLVNGARLVPGPIGKGVSLDGNDQYVDLGVPDDICLANLKRCKNGLTISLWIKSRELEDGTYFLSSPSYSLQYQSGQLFARFVCTF